MGHIAVNNSYFHDQTSESNTWVIVHNLDTLMPCADFWIDVSGTMTKIVPLTVTATDNNTLTATFTSAHAGRASVV
jgi:hypothetical protein